MYYLREISIRSRILDIKFLLLFLIFLFFWRVLQREIDLTSWNSFIGMQMKIFWFHVDWNLWLLSKLSLRVNNNFLFLRYWFCIYSFTPIHIIKVTFSFNCLFIQKINKFIMAEKIENYKFVKEWKHRNSE